MGVSDRHYFAWLRAALDRYEARSGHLSALRSEGSSLDVWVLAGARMNPAIEFVLDALGRERTSVKFMDKFAREPRVLEVDFNDLKGLADDSCDVLMMSRAAYMLRDPADFLDHIRRIVRPRGAVIIDWLHGVSELPVLHLPGVHTYGREVEPFLTTYCDPQFISEFPREFKAFLRHVNRPPSWVNVEEPGKRLPFWRRLKRMLSPAPRGRVTLATCLEAMRAALSRTGKRLIEPELMQQYFTIAFREARYFYPLSRKFHLYLLTVLRPVGK